MGVVTDKSLQGLTTAVQGISTSGMTDTTGQAIASAITALAGSISPTADNVSFDNTGTDLTSSDVEGAIKEVAVDTFKLITYTASYTAGGNASVSLTADDFGATAPTGYTPIAITDFATQSVNIAIRGVYAKATGTGTMMSMRNITSSSVTATAYITIMYTKSILL